MPAKKQSEYVSHEEFDAFKAEMYGRIGVDPNAPGPGEAGPPPLGQTEEVVPPDEEEA